MVSKKLWSFLLAVTIGLATTWILLGAVGMMSPALAQAAQGPQLEVNARLDKALPGSAPPSIISVADVLTGTDPLSIFDLGGNLVGEGTHQGQLRCKNNCSKETQLQLNGIEYQYQFKTRVTVDPGARIIVAAGTGVINSNGRKERFSFTVTFQDNGDGTQDITYVASNPDASFIVPASPGMMTFSQ